MEIVDNWLAQSRGNDYAIIQTEDTVTADEQVFSMFVVLWQLSHGLVLPIEHQRLDDTAKEFVYFPLELFS